ncbi:MAG TPA: substrate-binding domain-containing protein [Syntrophorhabdales bacterium]|nr:substrate-binding domain-containing protein [Syntrophorhabdales bacterium]
MLHMVMSSWEKGITGSFGRRVRLPFVVLALALVGAFAGSSGVFAASAGSAPDLGGYTGPDAQYIIRQLPEPVVKPGYKFKVGYLQVFAGAKPLMTIQTECEKKIKALGGTLIAYDAGLDVQKQVSQMDQLISQKVDIIIAYPTTEAALTQGTATAKAAGIPVLFVNVPSNSLTPMDPNAQATVGMAFDLYGYTTMKYIAQKYPKGKVAFIAFGPPAENLIHIVGRAKYWAKQMGLNILGQAEALDASPGAAGVAAQAIIGKYPDVQIIITYNEYSAMAAASALKAAGKTGILVATMNAGDDIIAGGIRNGSALCAYRDPWERVANAVAIAAYDVLTKQDLPARRILFVGDLATKDNVDSLTFVH